MKATVLIPNYNNEPYLLECLNSIKNQTYKDFDILIIDDGSTDKSLEIINNFKDDRIKVIQKEKNSGIIDTLNIGLKAINSEYIIRMDADDIMAKNRIEKLIIFMDKHPKFGACGSAIQHFGISAELIIYESNSNQNKANLIFGHSIGHASCIYRNSVIQKMNIKYTTGYKSMEDYKFFYDLSCVSQMTSIPDVLYFYRRENYNNYRNKSLIKKGTLKMYNQILSELKITPTDKNKELHIQIGKQWDFNYSFNEYESHCKLLLKQNKKLMIYNQSNLKKTINNTLNRLAFKLIDHKKISFTSVVKLASKNPKIGYYFLKSKIKSK